MENLNLPKKYFSWSQLRLWLENKNLYRERYYEGLTQPGSIYLMFGSEIAKGLDDKTIVIPDLIQYPVQEEQIKLEVNGIPFHGYIDQYDPARFKFREIKTGILKRGGKPRWTQRDVDRHGQLDVYSLLIEEKYGQVDDECHLDWLHTRMATVTTKFFDGTVLEGEGRKLELTGEVTTFSRVITKQDREKTRMIITSVAKEISQDYKAWLISNKDFIS